MEQRGWDIEESEASQRCGIVFLLLRRSQEGEDRAHGHGILAQEFVSGKKITIIYITI